MRHQPRVCVTLDTLHETHKKRKLGQQERVTPARAGAGRALSPVFVDPPRVNASHEVEVGHSEDQATELVAEEAVVSFSRHKVRDKERVPHPEICELLGAGKENVSSWRAFRAHVTRTSTRCIPEVSSLPTFLTSHHREGLNMTGRGSAMTRAVNASHNRGHVVGATLTVPTCANESQNA